MINLPRASVILVAVIAACAPPDASLPLAPDLGVGPPLSHEVVFVTGRSPSGDPSAAPRVASLPEAIQLVRPGGTIIIEDGTWETDGAVIDKPLTMTAAPNSDPLLINTAVGGTGLTIDGVPVGTVRLRGLRFENAAGASAVTAQGTYARILIRDVQVLVTAPPAGTGTAQGINATASTSPDGEVVVENSTFVGGRFCFYAQGTLAHVSGSSFSECSVAAVQFRLGSRGTIHGNTVDGCGVNACITAFDPDGIVISDNTVQHTVGTARFGIYSVATAAGSWTVTINRNDVVGLGVQPDDIVPYGPGCTPHCRPTRASAFNTGIGVAGDVVASVTGNRVNGAHWGISFTVLAPNNFGPGGSGNIIGNDVRDCGGICIFSQHPGTPTLIQDNVVRGDALFRRTGTAIFGKSQGASASITIARNTVIGNRRQGDDTDPSHYAFFVGIQALSWNPFQPDPGPAVTGNPIEAWGNAMSGVGQGLLANFGGFITAHDNALNGVARGVTADGPLSRVVANRNDMLLTAVAAAGDGVMDATCNWWGSVSGPVDAWVPPGVYTPWALVPIANQPGVACP